MERSLKTVVNRIPKFQDRLDEVRDVLVAKFKGEIIGAVTDFRQLSKIATAVDNLGLQKKEAEDALKKIFNKNNKTGIKAVYNSTVEFEYDEKKAEQHIKSLTEYINDLLEEEEEQEKLDDYFKSQLKELYYKLRELLGDE
jgi:RNA processing factor Prp31